MCPFKKKCALLIWAYFLEISNVQLPFSKAILQTCSHHLYTSAIKCLYCCRLDLWPWAWLSAHNCTCTDCLFVTYCMMLDCIHDALTHMYTEYPFQILDTKIQTNKCVPCLVVPLLQFRHVCETIFISEINKVPQDQQNFPFLFPVVFPSPPVAYVRDRKSNGIFQMEWVVAWTQWQLSIQTSLQTYRNH